MHFRQHYALDQRNIYRVFCGHCTYKKARSKKPWTAACDHFTPAPADTEAFATKEYLSKWILKYIMQLELLPEIQCQEKEDPA